MNSKENQYLTPLKAIAFLSCYFTSGCNKNKSKIIFTDNIKSININRNHTKTILPKNQITVRPSQSIRISNDDSIECSSLSIDKQKLAVAGTSGIIRIFSISNFSQINKISSNEDLVKSISFHSTDNIVIGTGFSHTILSISTASGKIIHKLTDDIPSQQIDSMDVSKDKLIACGSADGFAYLYDEKLTSAMATINCQKSGIYNVRFSPKGDFLAVTSGYKLFLIAISNLEIKASFFDPNEVISTVDFSTNKKHIALGSGGKNSYISVYDTSENRIVFRLKSISKNYITSVKYSPNGLLIAASSFNLITVWNAITGECKYLLKGHSKMVSSFHFLNDSEIISTDLAGNINKWKL